MSISTKVERLYDVRVGGEIVARDLSHMAADAEATALVGDGKTCEVHCTTVTTTTDRRRVRKYEP